MLVLGTNILDFFIVLFHGLQASAKFCIRKTILTVKHVLMVIILPCLAVIKRTDEFSSLSPKRQHNDLCCHAYKYSTGILTRFPFPQLSYERG